MLRRCLLHPLPPLVMSKHEQPSMPSLFYPLIPTLHATLCRRTDYGGRPKSNYMLRRCSLHPLPSLGMPKHEQPSTPSLFCSLIPTLNATLCRRTGMQSALIWIVPSVFTTDFVRASQKWPCPACPAHMAAATQSVVLASAVCRVTVPMVICIVYILQFPISLLRPPPATRIEWLRRLGKQQQGWHGV